MWCVWVSSEARSCATRNANNTDNMCEPTIPAGINRPPLSKTISLVTRVSDHLKTLSGTTRLLLVSDEGPYEKAYFSMRTSPSITFAVLVSLKRFIPPPGCVNPSHTNFKRYIPLAAKDLSISLGSNNPNIPLNTCKCSTETLLYLGYWYSNCT